MKPVDAEPLCRELFGENWKGPFAEALGIDYSTRWRILQRDKLPGPVEAAITAWILLHRTLHILPPENPLAPFKLQECAGASGMGLPPDDGFTGSPEDVDQAAVVLFGRKWKMKMASALGLNASTLWRQLTESELPGPVIASLRAWLALKATTGLVPPHSLTSLSRNRGATEASPPRTGRRKPKYADLNGE